MSTKHTPGPWTVDGPPSNQIVWSSAENRVCFLAHSNGLDDERDIATGHLIAAAPDLLEALVEAEAILTIAPPRYAADRDEAIAFLAKARAVIAKARCG